MGSEIRRPDEFAPTYGQERHDFLDSLRGFALLGIISANMILYSLYLYLPETAKARMSTHASDRVLDFLELVLVEGKFYTIFSVLFGVGFSILLTRTRAKELAFHRFFLRRVFILYLIGVVHAVVFWHDDILQFYALCGALLVLFVGARDRTILVSAVIALLAPAVIDLAGGIPSAPFEAPRVALFERFGFTREARVDIWRSGSFAEIVRLNLASWFGQLAYVVTSGMIFKIFGCFLLGFYLGRHEVYRKLPAYRSLLRWTAIAGIGAGIPLNVVYASTYESESWLHTASATVAILPMSAGYVAVVALLWLGPNGQRLLRHLAPVGRMALTNYVGQSVLCMLIFRGTGLGLGGRMGPTTYFPVGFAVYGLQILMSRLWLERYRFGPLEWVWRMLTYGSWITLSKPRPVTRGSVA